MSSTLLSNGPARPQNSAIPTLQQQQQQQQLQRIAINICVNHPIGAPQFAAISSITETDDDDKKKNDKAETSQQQNALLKDSSCSLFTAFPHDRGTFDGLILNRSVTNNNNNNSSSSKPSQQHQQPQQQRVQCFSTWASPHSYKSFFALSTSEKNEISDDDDDENDGDEDEDDDDNESGSDDDNDGNQDSSKNIRQPKRRQRGGSGKKKNHFAFKRVPEKLAEAWFVLSPATSENNGESTAVTSSYDMLPLMEVFSCQRKPYNESDKHRGDRKTVPKLTVDVKLSKLTLSQKYTKDFFKKKF